MHIRIDPVAGDAPVRLLRVESIQPQGRDEAEERQEPRRQEPAATYASAPAEEESGTYAPTPDALKAQRLLAPSPAAVLAVLQPVRTPDEEEKALYPSGTPAWMTALLKAR